MFGLVLVTSILAGLPFCLSQYGNCDYYQKINTDQTYYVYSTNYPNNYAPGTNCRWKAETDAGFRIVLKCTVFELPQSQNCMGDKVSISPTGNDLSDARMYCGTRTFTLTSTATNMLIVLHSTSTSRGGRFLCQINRQPTCDCGRKKNTRIVGGTTTGVNEYPMMCGLVDSNIRIIYCGATIISQRHAVTAAHCLLSRDLSKIGLLIGEHDITTDTDTNAARLMVLDSATPHPLFNARTQQNDIGIVRTRDMIQYSEDVGAACLPFNYVGSDFSGAEVIALGYGSTEFGGAQSNTLQKVSLTALSPSQCSPSYPSSNPATQLCTYEPNKDACQSDSGGPVTWFGPAVQRVFLLGTISSGYGCATTKPGMNTRITAFLDWITANTPGVVYCRK